MVNTFETYEKAFAQQNLSYFNGNLEGILWLKLRAIARRKQLVTFMKQMGLVAASKTIKKQTIELFYSLSTDVNKANLVLDVFLRNVENELYAELNINTEQLKEDLYNVRDYHWGGDYNNSLDRYLIKSYVKGLPSFQKLLEQKEDIAENAWHYVKNSWYNHWTSYLIESIFKKHDRVVSAVGAIRSVDFFVDDCPIDLKVTYFPKVYMDLKFRECTGSNEIAWLKQKAKEREFRIPQRMDSATLEYYLREKFAESGVKDVLDELRGIKEKILNKTIAAPEELMLWLYVNQGEMRFGAENRLFLILIDLDDFTQSWKLKRAFDMLTPKINSYLSSFAVEQLSEISFTHQGRMYTSLSDSLFVLK